MPGRTIDAAAPNIFPRESQGARLLLDIEVMVTPVRLWVASWMVLGCSSEPQTGPPDGGEVCVNGLPCCPREFDRNTAQNPDLIYPRAAVGIPPEGLSTGVGLPVDAWATWVGVRALATGVRMGCPDDLQHPDCVSQTVIQLRENGGTLMEFVVTVPADRFTTFVPGLEVAVQARGISDRTGLPTPGNQLVLRRRSDDALLLAIASGAESYSGFVVPVRDRTAFCASRPESFCNRTLTAFALSFGPTGTPWAEVPPGASTVVDTREGRYFLRNRVAYRRTPSGSRAECADATSPVTSFEIVRQSP